MNFDLKYSRLFSGHDVVQYYMASSRRGENQRCFNNIRPIAIQRTVSADDDH